MCSTLLFTTGGAEPLCVAQHYRVMTLPLQPKSINAVGQVVGTSAQHHAALWTETGGLTELPVPPGFVNADAVAVDDSGDIAVNAYDRSYGVHQAFLYAGGVLHPLAGKQSLAFGMNDAGDIVGEALKPGTPTSEPILWRGQRVIALGGCCAGSAKRVNARGDVVGNAYDAEGRYHAFLWTDAKGMQFMEPGSRFSAALAINRSGQVVVQTFPEIYVHDAGGRLHVELSARFPSQPHALSDCGVMVGSFGANSKSEHAFFWEKVTGFAPLNARIDADRGWRLQSAVDINAQGEIVGYGEYKGKDETGFLLKPVVP